MNLEEQKKILNEYWWDGLNYAFNRMGSSKNYLKRLAEKRFELGYNQFRDDIFVNEDQFSLTKELDEELADAIVYGAVMKWHEEQDRAAYAKRQS